MPKTNRPTKIPVPSLQRRAVIKVIESEGRKEREEAAFLRLAEFRWKARKQAAFRFLREARRVQPSRYLDEFELLNLTGRDGPVLEEAVVKIGRKFECSQLVLLVLDEKSQLADARGPIPMRPWNECRWWADGWRQRGTNLGCLFLPSDFCEDEFVYPPSAGCVEKPLQGRADLIYYILTDVFWSLGEKENPDRLKRRMAGWQLDKITGPGQYASHLVAQIRKP